MKSVEKYNNSAIIPSEVIENRIYIIRGQKVMIGQDLAKLYMVPTGVLIQAVKRNIDRFSSDFIFELSRKKSRGYHNL